jgi:hypothetical protein
MTERVFVFTESKRSAENSFRGPKRPRKYAIRESEIAEIYTQVGSEATYLVINGIEVEGTFDELVSLLGERVDVK